MRRVGFAVALTLVTSLAAKPALAQSVTIGTSNPSEPNCIPFDCPKTYDIARYQQVYSASAFAGITSPITINAISFFQSTSYGGALGNAVFTIFLSTTSAAVNGLSSNLASNVGSNNQQFATIITSGTTTPSVFTINGSGFLYDPTAGGNLLLDIFVSGVGPDLAYGYLDSDATGVSMSRIRQFSNGFALADQRARVTMFSYGPGTQPPGTEPPGTEPPTVTPEPATLSLLGLGLAGIGGWKRRRSRKVA
jgi:hypothetical protein